MAYSDRLRIAAYTPPNGGTPIVLNFDEVSRDGEKKVAVHELLQQDGADVQDLGNKARRFTLDCYFTGDDYDQAADAFDAALSQKGAGGLQHPRWGDIPVQVLGWTQTEKLVDGVGRADFSVSFIRVDDSAAFPMTTVSAEVTIGTNVDAAAAASAARAAANFSPSDAADVADCKANVLGWLDTYEGAFATVTSWSDSVQTSVNAQVSAVRTGIDRLIGAPLELFTSLASLAALPARVFGSITRKIAAYAELVATTAAQVPASYAEALASVQGLVYALGGAAVASTVGELKTRAEAVAAAEALDSIGETIEAAVEAIEASIPGFRADPETLATLAETMALAKADLVDRSYSLKIERRVRLATERTPIDLVVEFNGTDLTDLDAALDAFAATNNLQGDELVLVPAGREVVYYVG